MNNQKAHNDLKEEVMKALQAKFQDIRLFNSPVGFFRSMYGTRSIRVGKKGQCDINGVINIGGIGVRIEIEIKTGSGRLGTDQRNWKKTMSDMGCIYILAKNVDDAVLEMEKGYDRIKGILKEYEYYEPGYFC